VGSIVGLCGLGSFLFLAAIFVQGVVPLPDCVTSFTQLFDIDPKVSSRRLVDFEFRFALFFGRATLLHELVVASPCCKVFLLGGTPIVTDLVGHRVPCMDVFSLIHLLLRLLVLLGHLPFLS
jgi:hypothetical protein